MALGMVGIAFWIVNQHRTPRAPDHNLPAKTTGHRAVTKPFELKPVAAVTLRPGESRSVTVSVERHNFNGVIELWVEGLPDKVTASSATIDAGRDSADLQFAAADDAAEKELQAEVVARAGAAQEKAKVQVTVKAEAP
jgi:hypothetical protein